LVASHPESLSSRIAPIGVGGPADPEEPRLVAASVAGDREAFAALVTRHHRRVLRLCGRFFVRPEDVEEVFQETFLLAWRKVHSYRGDAPFEHWVTRLCLNVCFQRLRRRGRRDRRAAPRATTVPSSDPTAPPTEEATLARLEVARLMGTLRPGERIVLVLLYAEEWSVAEVAERLGWSRSKVKMRALRARRKLAKFVEESRP